MVDASVTQLIVAVTGILVPITGILAYIFPKLQKVANSVKATDGWVLEHEERLANNEKVIKQLSPQAKEILDKYSGDIGQATADLDLVKQELTQYYGELPSSKTKDFPAVV